jgi:hypothetical protein
LQFNNGLHWSWCPQELEHGQQQEQEQQLNELPVVYVAEQEEPPCWSKNGSRLIMQLPGGKPEGTCRGVRLQLGSMLLSAAVTADVKIEPCSSGNYQVTGLRSVKQLIHGAQLLPCGAVDGEDGWVLVLRAEWRVADFGEEVSVGIG